MIPLGQGRGPLPARILIVGEAWGAEEARLGKPFVGASGKELGRMLHDAKLLESDCRLTNVINARPPNNNIDAWFCKTKKAAKDEGVLELHKRYPKDIVYKGLMDLAKEITATIPDIIIPLGNTALWALTGETGITNWRGSLLDLSGPVVDLYPNLENKRHRVVPTYHPAAILRSWHWRHIAVHDLRYAKQQVENPTAKPDYQFTIRPTFDQAITFLRHLRGRLDSTHRYRFSADIETRQGQIACLGIGTTALDAFCIPFLSVEKPEGYWSLDEETEIVYLLRGILQHPSAEIIWQNGLYDIQYIYDNWHFIAHITHDTMLMQHAVFPGLPKGLDFLRSMYCRYRRYWKDDVKEWVPKKATEDTLWTYNCEDCVVTYEIAGPLLDTIEHLKLQNIYAHSMSLYEPVLFMMMNGVRIDTSIHAQMAEDLMVAGIALDDWIAFVVDEPFNVKSAPQMRRLFYDELGVPVQRNRKTGNPSLDKQALQKIYDNNPLLQPLIDRILLRRRVGVFFNTFLKAPLDPDQRMRCSYHIGGTETGRFSSSENAFGRGTNLENIPRPPEKHEVESTPIVRMPNVRSMFIPDPGMVIADFDLDRADAHIVAWEAGDESLKTLFRAGADIHAENAKVIGSSRQLAKSFVHGTNYGGGPRTVAGHCGISIPAAERGQSLWFKAHPKIRGWHQHVEAQLQTTRRVVTVFGRVRYYFDRIDPNVLHQALAYLGQSPVAHVINVGLRNVYDQLPWCQLLLQNHDSLVLQLPNDNLGERFEDIRRALSVPVPYDDPLTIPVGCKYSERSWGELKAWEFDT